MTRFLQTAVGGLSVGTVYALVALGFSLVYRTMGLVNFGHGDILMVGAFIAATFFVTWHLPFPLAIGGAVLIAAALGFAIERVMRPLERRDLGLMLIGTIGAGIALEGAAQLIWGSVGTAVPFPVSSAPIHVAGVLINPYDLVVIAVATAVMLVLHAFLTRSKAGIALQAAAMDRDAATAVGIDVARCNARAFAIGAGLAALAGGLIGPLTYVQVGMGSSIGLRGFAAAILGGFGSIPGAIAGGLAFGLIEEFAQGSSYGAYTDVITFVAFALVLMVRPGGLLGDHSPVRS
jgi:branched-chain amino acid transport system permease protein